MNKVEVTLGTDAGVTPTQVEIRSTNQKVPIIGAVVGALAGFGFAKYRNVEGNAKWIFTGVGAVAGFFIAKMIVKKGLILVKKSK